MNAGLISVVVPAFNAARTLDETLMSARRQSYDRLEIVVVDDGSTDDTCAIACQHAQQDRRVRVLSIAGSGVAAARNAGIAATCGEFIAPLDADDLWHPTKIAKQLKACKPEIGIVYAFYRRIDERGHIVDSGAGAAFEGPAYNRLLLYNFVGNGSALLIRRAALRPYGGYEQGLHRRNAQGCEDYLLQALIARHWEVTCVPEYLVGYRLAEGSMSTNWERMARSHLLMLEYVLNVFPETPRNVSAASEALGRAKLAVIMLRQGRLRAFADEARKALRLDAPVALETAWMTIYFVLSGLLRRFTGNGRGRAPPTPFLEADPRSAAYPSWGVPYRRRLAEFAELDRTLSLQRAGPQVRAPAAPCSAAEGG